MLCYCDSKKEFKECCEPFLNKSKKPSSPQELMQSRYSAFVLGDEKYLQESIAKKNAQEEEHVQKVVWLGLDIIKVENTSVEFKAYYRDMQGISVQHERSFFVKEGDSWFYKDGVLFHSKIERNEPCPCKSGKKYKKCCG